MQRYILTGNENPRLKLASADVRQPEKGEVAVDLRAASLNFRDVIIARNFKDVVPLSDGAGIVSVVGEQVDGWEVGDRVVIGFMPGWVDGPITVVPADSIVRLPDAMTFEEAATLPCAGVTAFAALFERRPVQPGESVLLLGTGGVSIFALQLAKKAGARVIITSSSDEKL